MSASLPARAGPRLKVFECRSDFSETVVELPRFSDVADDGITPESFLDDAQALDMPSLLSTVLLGERALPNSPLLLAIRVPAYWERADGSRMWLDGCGITANWGDRREVELHIGGAKVVYSLRAYVQYLVDSAVDDQEPPTELRRRVGGHYVSHFESDGQWYTADDDEVFVRAPEWHHECPAVCFLERQDASPPPHAWPARAVLQHGDDDENEEAQEQPPEPPAKRKKGSVRKRPSVSKPEEEPLAKCRQQDRHRDRHRHDGRLQDRSERLQTRSGWWRRQARRQQTGRQQTGRQQKRCDQKPGAAESIRRMPRSRCTGDNHDGSRRDKNNDLMTPVARADAELQRLARATQDRRELGDLFLMLQLLEPWMDGREAIRLLPEFLTYAGDDCACKWARYLCDPERPQALYRRLQEALGVSDGEIAAAKAKRESGAWSLRNVIEMLEERLLSGAAKCPNASILHLIDEPEGDACSSNPIREYLGGAFPARLHNEGPPGRAAMPDRLRDRTRWFTGAHSTLRYCCELCEAEFPSQQAYEMHVAAVHGGARWHQLQFEMHQELAPYVPSPTESRAMIERYANAVEQATAEPENEAYSPRPPLGKQKGYLWAELFCIFAAPHAGTPRTTRKPCGDSIGRPANDEDVAAVRLFQATCVEECEAKPCAPEHRAFQACVCCAMMQWSENLHSEYLVGPQCTIQDRRAFAENLSAEWYHRRWPLIPRDDLLASAVDFPHEDAEGEETTTKILLHKRRVPPEALTGEVPVRVCTDCRTALWAKRPTVPRLALVNDLWLGRHPPLLRAANLAHQLLLALGRVVSTKLYLSSKGADTAVRQERESWRQKFLQYAIKGTSIVFGNGRADQAMRSFPPEPGVLKETFIAVFAGADEDEGVTLTDEQKQARAVKAMREEIGLQVEKSLFDKQAKLLREHNYVYNDPDVHYREDLVKDFPTQAAVPSCFTACAQYVPTTSGLDDNTQAVGPASSTTGAQLEQEAAEEDAQELTKWLSVVEEQMDDVSELTSLPSLQGLAERMESQAGRVVANELSAVHYVLIRLSASEP